MTYRAMTYDEGLFSARPAASVGNGYVYFATDTGNLYRSDGSTWTLIGSTGGGGGAVSSVFTRTGAVVAVNGDYYGVVAAALTGATAASRYVGATASGAPGSGTFLKGDFIVDQTGAFYVCTVAGSPGTWVAVGSGASFATPAIVLGTAAAAGSAGTVIRSDATIVAFDATAPTTQAYGDSAATGSAAVAARRDHKHGFPAAVTDATIATSDITTNDVGITKHGWAPKSPNDSTKFLNGVGAYSVPAGTGTTTTVATDAIWDAKGDLAAATGPDAAIALTVGANGTVLTADSAQTAGVKWSAPGVANLVRSARSSNSILAAADKGTVICASAAFTQTFTAAATLGAGWWVIVKNDTTSGTVAVVLDPNGSETIDGLTTVTMYSGETRLIECDGNNFFSQLIEGGYAKFTPTGGNFIVPAGATTFHVSCVGSGGQGGGGPSSAATAKAGGSAGGGGAVAVASLRAADVGAAGTTVTVTVAAGGSGANGGTGGANGSNGANGGTTSFGTLLKAAGGGGGTAGQVANLVGGGGASVIANAATVTAGAPSSVTAIGAQGALVPASGNNAGLNAEWGGASGGGNATGTVTAGAGGSSIYGGPGGGGGANSSTVAVGTAGAGGATKSYTAGGGAAAGSGGTFTGPYCGTGGGGGTGALSGTAGTGGAGSIGAGGGGGGVCLASGAGGPGGAGGDGECRVWYS